MDKLPISDHLEKVISEYTLPKIVEQFEMVGYYDNLGHQLENNVAFIALKRLALNNSAEQSRQIAVLVAVLGECRDKWDTAGNGRCNVCGYGHRLFDLKGNVQKCSEVDCLSHRIRKALAESQRIQEGK